MDQASTLRMMVEDSPRIRTTNLLHVISVTSGKGGVGKTNVVANLAIALAKWGKRVMILDADLGLGNIDILLGLAPKYNIHHLLSGEKNLSEIIVNGPWGIKILPASSGIQEITNLSRDQQLNLLSEMDQLNDEVDFVLIDTGAGISSNVLYFNISAQDIIVVVTPEPTSITDAYALMKVLSKKHDEKHFKLLVNLVRREEEAKEVYRKISLVADRFLNISIDYIGYIPIDSNITRAVCQQKAIIDLFPESLSSKGFNLLAKSLCDWPPPIQPKASIQFLWQRLVSGFPANMAGVR